MFEAPCKAPIGVAAIGVAAIGVAAIGLAAIEEGMMMIIYH